MATQFATVQNRINNATDNGGSTAVGVQGATAVEARLGWGRRWHHTFGSGNLDKIRFSYDNWRGEASNNQEFLTGNSHTITAGHMDYNGIIVPILFGGNRSITINDGDAEVLSDWIYPSQFSLSEFPRGDTFFTKEHGTVPGPTPATNGKMPTSYRQTADFAGCQMFFYAAGQTTLSDIDTPGMFTSTGATRYDRSSGACPIVLGTYVGGDKPVRMAFGDSMTQGTGDGTAFKHGRGHFQRAQVDADGTSNVYSSANFAVHGSAATLAVQGTKMRSYCKYATSVLIYYGTNDFGITDGASITPTGMMTRINNIKTAAQANGITRFGIMALGPRADSTDNWATEANQTVRTGWGSGGNPDQFNASLGAQGYDVVFPNTAVRGTDVYKFLTNGSANYTAFDNTHYSAGGANLTANQNRTLYSQLDPQAGDTVPNAFTFTDQTNVAVNSVITSNTLTLSGTDAAAAITVTGGEYQIAGGSFTSSPGTISPGQTFAVRGTSSALNSTAVNVVLTIGGVSDTFTITTIAGVNDTVPDAFTFVPVIGAALSSQQTSNSVTITGINASTPISVTGGSYSIDGGSFVTSSGSITNGQTVRVRGNASASNSTETIVTLTIGGIPGSYSIVTLAAPSVQGDVTPQEMMKRRRFVAIKYAQLYGRAALFGGKRK